MRTHGDPLGLYQNLYAASLGMFADYPASVNDNKLTQRALNRADKTENNKKK